MLNTFVFLFSNKFEAKTSTNITNNSNKKLYRFVNKLKKKEKNGLE
jgi:hypothetical protein